MFFGVVKLSFGVVFLENFVLDWSVKSMVVTTGRFPAI
jgi:hypothetical protein